MTNLFEQYLASAVEYLFNIGKSENAKKLMTCRIKTMEVMKDYDQDGYLYNYWEIQLRGSAIFCEEFADEPDRKPSELWSDVFDAITSVLPRLDSEVVPTIISKIEHHIFLSYSRKDTLIMQRIRDDLRKKYLTVWTDEDLKPGTPAWTIAIQNAIENTGCIVVVLSPDAKQSKWVDKELGYGEAFGIGCFPVLARGTKTDAIPIGLINTQYTDIQSNYDVQLDKLVSAIREHVGIVR